MSLQATVANGWSTGFGNLLSKELGSWWRTRRWIVHLILWLVVISGFVVLTSLEDSNSPAQRFSNAMEIFFQVGGFFGVIGAILVSQGAIVGERNSGTAAWVLTKPTTRKAFVLSKLVAITTSFLLLSLVVPAVATLIASRLLLDRLPEAAHFAEALGIQTVHQVFYIALTLMLGTFFRTRGPVAGAALGFWVSGNILINLIPKWATLAMPWLLSGAAASIALWKPIAFPVWIPVVSSVVLTVLFVAVALWRFEREEF